MERKELTERLREKEEPEVYAQLGYSDAAVIPLFVEIMETERSAVKYQAEKAIRKISEESPAVLLSYSDRLIGLLDSENNFVKWGILLTLPNLLKAGGRELWTRMRQPYLKSFQSQQVAEFGNAVSCVKKIIKVCPEEEKTIIPILLNIDSHTFLHHEAPSPECLNIAKGHILDCFLELYPESGYREEMAAFAEKNLDNERKQVGVKARRLVRLV